MSYKPLKHLPGHWEICSSCSGEGASSAYLGSFTREQLDEDPDFFEEYRNGAYDRPCEHCSNGRVWTLDPDRMNAEQRAEYDGEQDRLEGEIEAYRERRHESLMLGESRLEDWY